MEFTGEHTDECTTDKFDQKKLTYRLTAQVS